MNGHVRVLARVVFVRTAPSDCELDLWMAAPKLGEPRVEPTFEKAGIADNDEPRGNTLAPAAGSNRMDS